MDWRKQPRVWFAIAAALLLWAAAFAGIRLGLRSYGPGQVALLRFGTASIALAIFALVTRMRLPDSRDLAVIALAGFLGITVYHVALNYGEQTVQAGAAALLISTSPVFTAMFSRRLLGERLNRWAWAGILIAFAGAVVIAFAQGGGVSVNADALLILVAAVATSLYFIVSKPPLRRYNALEFTTYAIWAGTIPLFVFLPGLVEQIPHADPSSTIAVVLLGIFPGAISYVLWSYALSKMSASVLSAFLYFQPVNATIIAWLWLGEIPTLLTIVGGAVSLGGVALVNTKGAERG